MISNQGPTPAPATLDVWALLDLGLERWLCIAGWMAILGAAGAMLAHWAWGRSFTATAELIHYAPSAVEDTYHPRDLATPSLVGLLQAPGLLEEVGAQAHPPLSGRQLASRLVITLDRNNDVATVTGVGPARQETADLVDRFCRVAIAYTQTLQRREALEAGDNVSRQLAQIEREIALARVAAPPVAAPVFSAEAAGSDPAAAVGGDRTQRIQAAQNQLDDLLMRYTDAHPLVRAQRERLAALVALEANAPVPLAGPRAAASPAQPAAAAPPAYPTRLTPEEAGMAERLRSLETNRALLLGRLGAIQPFRDHAPGYFRVLRLASDNPVFEQHHRLELAVGACLGAFLGLMGAASQLLLAELLDNRIKSRNDLRRVTGLPLLAALGDLTQLSAAQRDQWAFRTWIALRARLDPEPMSGLICGVASAEPGEGRSTCVGLLAEAARAGGFRVLTVGPEPGPGTAPELAAVWTQRLLTASREVEASAASATTPLVVHLSLPRWTWTRERRQQWRLALKAWSGREELVVLVELPPMSDDAAVLLAEGLPGVLWLAASRRSGARETIAGLACLRQAHCPVVGAVLNREFRTSLRGRFSRWTAPAAALGAAAALLPALSAAPPAAFSVAEPEQRAEWQRRLTLGPGDMLTLRVNGAPELTREQVPIGPDGRLSYLEADNLPVAGLTIDELRARLTRELSRYRRAAEVLVTPVAYPSKHYTVLGAVGEKGSFRLDRPVTLLEAVARAHGFAAGAARAESGDQPDFAHAFLARRGRHVPVDFTALFRRGDLAQNVALEPDDYLYFPAAPAAAITVLGEVLRPGAVPLEAEASVLSAIAARGGFTERAWQKKVLIVRGALTRPETFSVDVGAALRGRGPNLALQAGDVVYVSGRPWFKAEELLDRATAAFIESAVVTWTGLNVGPAIFSRPSPAP